jgi:hypothetical protein
MTFETTDAILSIDGRPVEKNGLQANRFCNTRSVKMRTISGIGILTIKLSCCKIQIFNARKYSFSNDLRDIAA